MRKTTHGWTVVYSLYRISVTFPTSHAERSPLNCFALLNTDDGEDIERGGGGGETSVSVGSEMEKRERRRRHEEDNTRVDSSALTVSHIGDLPDIPRPDGAVLAVALAARDVAVGVRAGSAAAGFPGAARERVSCPNSSYLLARLLCRAVAMSS